LQSFLDFLGIDAEFAARDDVQWSAKGFANRFSSKSLTGPRLAVQQHDKTSAFPANHVTFNTGREDGGVDEAGEDFLLPLVNDQSIDCVCRPLN
jgi:hypothetical protein